MDFHFAAVELWNSMSPCEAALQLFDCIKEPVSGLGSLLYISCSNSECGETNTCRTNKTHRSTGTTRGRPIFDVNTKLAAGLFTLNVAKSLVFHQYSIHLTSSQFVNKLNRNIYRDATRRHRSYPRKRVVIIHQYTITWRVHAEGSREGSGAPS